MTRLRAGTAILLTATFCGTSLLLADDKNATNTADWVPVVWKLPTPVFSGTPKTAPAGISVEPTPAKPPVIKVPPDVVNIAPGKKITSSDKTIARSDLGKLTDGRKDADGEDILELRKGLQWVQFDLGSPQEIYAIALWHAHDTAKIFRAVIIQVADDQDFTDNVRTLFNNDRDNSAGLGAGTDRQYFETYQGKELETKGVKARFVRFYSDGSTDSKLNEYTEVEIYGRPAK